MEQESANGVSALTCYRRSRPNSDVRCRSDNVHNDPFGKHFGLVIYDGADLSHSVFASVFDFDQVWFNKPN